MLRNLCSGTGSEPCGRAGSSGSYTRRCQEVLSQEEDAPAAEFTTEATMLSQSFLIPLLPPPLLPQPCLKLSRKIDSVETQDIASEIIRLSPDMDARGNKAQNTSLPPFEPSCRAIPNSDSPVFRSCYERPGGGC